MRTTRTKTALRTCAFIGAVLATGMAPTSILAETQVRLQSSSDAAAFSEGYALSVEDWSAQTRQSQARASSQFWHHSQERPQVWIRDIGTLLFDDFDGDGYHSGFSITIDVDSEYGDTEVYANIYLQSDDNPLELLHKTSRFSVYGTTIGDEYRVDTELRNNFVSDEYNVVVDIHDAWSDTLLDTANSRGFDNLSSLPLESSEQSNHSPTEDYQEHAGSADVVVTEYAGAFHPGMLVILLGGWLVANRRGRVIRSKVLEKRNSDE